MGCFFFDAENINKLSNIIIERTPGYYMFEAGTIYSYHMQGGTIDKSKIKSAERNEPTYDIILTKRTRLKAFQSVK